MGIGKTLCKSFARGNAAVFLIALASVLMFDICRHCENLYRLERRIIANLGGGALSDLCKPGGGENVLPIEVQVMLSFLRSAKADSFTFSRAIAHNVKRTQRLVEGAYPLRVDENAHYHLYMEHEPLPQACRPLMNRGGIALAYCP